MGQTIAHALDPPTRQHMGQTIARALDPPTRQCFGHPDGQHMGPPSVHAHAMYQPDGQHTGHSLVHTMHQPDGHYKGLPGELNGKQILLYNVDLPNCSTMTSSLSFRQLLLFLSLFSYLYLPRKF